MQDLRKETQRVIASSAPGTVADLAERYVRRGFTIGGPAMAQDPAGPVRVVDVPWVRRVPALTHLLELLDPASVAVWTLDRSQHQAIAQAIPLAESNVQLVMGDAPSVELVVAFDPPSPTRLRQLLRAGEVVLLSPPGTETYVGRIASPRRPLRLPGVLDAAATRASARRSAIVRAIESGPIDLGLATLAPLLERFEAPRVAAALFELWTGAAGEPGIPLPPDLPATAKVYVGIGKKDGATVNDLVAVLTKEVRLDRGKIGRVELRESYMLVEVPAQEAERVVSALNGTTIRRRRVTARVDRGTPGRPPGRGARPPG
jgi:DbpA RNA binding domain